MKRKKQTDDVTAEFEESTSRKERYVLRLYVTGMTPRSLEAFTTVKSLCDELLQEDYDLEVIDIYQHPEAAKEQEIIASPTLVKKLPLPLRRLIGNLSDEGRVLTGLGLHRTA